jgi:hypothetical protein
VQSSGGPVPLSADCLVLNSAWWPRGCIQYPVVDETRPTNPNAEILPSSLPLHRIQYIDLVADLESFRQRSIMVPTSPLLVRSKTFTLLPTHSLLL